MSKKDTLDLDRKIDNRSITLLEISVNLLSSSLYSSESHYKSKNRFLKSENFGFRIDKYDKELNWKSHPIHFERVLLMGLKRVFDGLKASF